MWFYPCVVSQREKWTSPSPKDRGNLRQPLFLPPYFPAPYKDIMLVIAGEYKNKEAGNLSYILIFSFCLSQSIKWIGQICWSAWKLTQKRNNEKKKKFSFESGSELLILQEFYPWSYIKSRASMPVNGKRKQEQSFWHYLLLSTDLGVCKLAKLEQTWPNNHNSVFLLQ